MVSSRGALLILEGCDRAGKTTQARCLVKSLCEEGISVEFMRFPDRTSQIGALIDKYLSCSTDINDHAIHLLFSANRWEFSSHILNTLNKGTSLVIDRYAYSGAAFSAAKEGLDLEWCKQCDVGLPKPDAVLFLDLDPQKALDRVSTNEERYETIDFQKKVYKNFKKLEDKSWHIIGYNDVTTTENKFTNRLPVVHGPLAGVIDAGKDIEEVAKDLKRISLEKIFEVGDKKIDKLWM